MNKKLVLLMILIIALVGMLTLTFDVHQAEARTIVVPDDYPMIQQAVNAAVNGDTILVRAGTYSEDIVINSKSISLIGENASNTTIKGVTPTKDG